MDGSGDANNDFCATSLAKVEQDLRHPLQVLHDGRQLVLGQLRRRQQRHVGGDGVGQRVTEGGPLRLQQLRMRRRDGDGHTDGGEAKELKADSGRLKAVSYLPIAFAIVSPISAGDTTT